MAVAMLGQAASAVGRATTSMWARLSPEMKKKVMSAIPGVSNDVEAEATLRSAAAGNSDAARALITASVVNKLELPDDLTRKYPSAAEMFRQHRIEMDGIERAIDRDPMASAAESFEARIGMVSTIMSHCRTGDPEDVVALVTAFHALTPAEVRSTCAQARSLGLALPRPPRRRT